MKQILFEVAQNIEGILASPPPVPLTISYDDFYITYGLKFYIKDFEDQIILKDKIMTQLFKVAEDRNLTIPFPITEVKLWKEDTS